MKRKLVQGADSLAHNGKFATASKCKLAAYGETCEHSERVRGLSRGVVHFIAIVIGVIVTLACSSVFVACGGNTGNAGDKDGANGGGNGGDAASSALIFIEVDGGYSVKCISSNISSVIIPETYNGKPVTSIGSEAFSDCSSLKSITIPNSVTSIVSGAFSYRISLTRIDYTGDIESWCGMNGLYNLMSNGATDRKLFISGTEIAGDLIIPTGVTSIGSSAFSDCRSLTSITIPNSVTSIGSSAFSDCRSLTSITIPNSVTSIGDYAFSYCSSLTSITIPNSVTSINYAFSGCSSLTIYCEATSKPSGWDSSWNKKGDYSSCPVVWGCKSNSKDENGYEYSIINGMRYSLKDGVATVVGQPTNISGSITIPTSITYNGTNYSVTSIDGYAFYNCRSLTSIMVPNSVTSIGDRAFENCSSLTSITVETGNTKYHSAGNCIIETATKTLIAGCKNSIIPTDGSVTSIGRYAFYDCSSLTSITIPTGVTSIGYQAFYYCSSLTSITIPTGVTSIGSYAFSDCSSLTSITIPNSVTSIGYEAFYNCRSLTSITIPNSVTSIGSRAFYNCNALTIYCETTSAPSSWDSSWTYSSCPVVWDCKNNDIATDGYIYSVINGVRYSLKDGVATVVRQPKNISGAITIPTSVTYNGTAYSVKWISDYAFSGCRSLTSIMIPSSVTSIGYQAFYNCNNLTSITIPTGVTSIGSSAFSDCRSLTSITIPNSVTSIGSYAFSYCSSLTSITIGTGVTSINAGVFSNCNSLTSITVASGNTKYHSTGNCLIETATKTLIAGCKNSVIPTDGSVTSIGEYAFSGCSSLTSITIPTGVTSIGYEAFYYCYNLIQTENGVKYVDKWVVGCDMWSVTSVSLRANTVGIADSAFYGCSSLTSITIPTGVTSIGEYAFRYCRRLTSITFQGTKSQWNAIAKGSLWNDDTGNYTIHCTDGDIAKS